MCPPLAPRRLFMRLPAFSSLAALALLTAAPAFAQKPEELPAPKPFQPQIQDPMLDPAPRPERQVATWQEAMDLIRSRSTDLRSAEAGVLRAEGRWKQSLSGLLP